MKCLDGPTLILDGPDMAWWVQLSHQTTFLDCSFDPPVTSFQYGAVLSIIVENILIVISFWKGPQWIASLWAQKLSGSRILSIFSAVVDL